QTRLRTGEQRRVFRMIPGLENAEFLRYGSIHRNTYLNFPAHLNAYGAHPTRPDLIFAGQLTGVEGYTESAASGILAGVNLDRIVRGLEPVLPPSTTMLGGLYRYLREGDPKAFAPMNSNFGLLDPLRERIRDKRAKRERLVDRARRDFAAWMREHGIEPVEVGAGATARSRRQQGARRDRRVHPAPGGRTAAQPAHGGGVPPGPHGIRSVPGPVLRRGGVDVGRGRSPRPACLPGRHVAEGIVPSYDRTEAVRRSLLLPLVAPRGDGRSQPGTRGTLSQAGATPSGLAESQRHGARPPARREPRGRGRFPRSTRPGDRRDLLLHRDASLRAA